MQRPYTERIIAWTLAIFSVAVVWQFDIPTILKSLTISLGVKEGTFFYHTIIDGGISFIFVGISWGVLQVYDTIIWRWLPWLGCKRGWWIYGLIAQREQGSFQRVELIGLFYVLHTPDEIQIKEGHAFYLEEGQINPRGYWHADCVWIREGKMQMLFSMHSIHPTPEALPSMYDGYLALSQIQSRALVGKECWRGYFFDLGDRKEVHGEVYTERLSSFRVRHSEKAEQIMRSYVDQLVGRV